MSEYKEHIDVILNKTYEVRNIMEHRYLKILSYEDKDTDKSDSDELAYVISREEFENLAMNLLRVSRESVILLVMAINIEEINKNNNKENIVNMNLSGYDDEWKF